MVAEKISVGSRIDLSGSKGTVKYVGEVSNAEGIWLGVDWDDPKRGKHNGTYQGVQYFQASYPTSGSFVRSSKVSTGISIVDAIKERYGMTSDPNGGLDQESIIEVQREIKAKFFEVVGTEKLYKTQSDFKNLQVVFLRDFPVIGAGPPFALALLCPNIQELDLSKTLLSSWEAVAEIAQQLKNLAILNLSENHLKIVDNINPESFSHVQHVILGKLNYDWFDALQCAKFFLNVQAFQLQYNKIEIIEAPSETIFKNLQMLDLEGNPLKSWSEINKMGNVITLETLNVSNCGIVDVFFPSSNISEFTPLFINLKNLMLTGNKINEWLSISELDKLKSLYDLKFKDNPVLTKETTETNHQLIIAKVKNLQVLNGEPILKGERKGAEIDYLKRFGKAWLGIKSEEEKNNFNKIHPNYQRLVEKYGPPEENELKKPPTSLKSQLIQIDISSSDKVFSKKVPYNMSVQKLSGLIQRLFNTGSTMPNISLIHAKRPDGLAVPLDDTLKDLNFYSVENGDKILVDW